MRNSILKRLPPTRQFMLAGVLSLLNLLTASANDPEIAFGQEMTAEKRARASRVMVLLEKLGIQVSRPWAEAGAFEAPETTPSLNAHDWCLLTLEAKAKLPGQSGPGEAAARFLHQKGVTEDRLQTVKAKYNATDTEIHQAVRNYLRIMEVAEQARNSAPAVTDEAVSKVIELTGRKIKVGVISLDARKIIESMPHPTTEQLKEHYEQYRRVHPERSPNGIGYLNEHLVQLEIVSLHVDVLKPQIEVTEQEIEEYWANDQDEFWVTDEGVTLAVGSEEEHVLENFRERVADVIRLEKVHARARPAMQELLADLREPFVWAPTDSQGYEIAPGHVRSMNYLQTRVDRIAQKHDIILPVIQTDYVPVTQSGMLGGIGRAQFEDVDGQSIAFEDLVRRTKGLSEQPATPGDPFALGLFQPSPILSNSLDDREYDLFIYRVSGIKQNEPSAFATIYGQLIYDWRLLRAYEQTHTRAKGLAEDARYNGLQHTWSQTPDLREIYGDPPREVNLVRCQLAPEPLFVQTNEVLVPTRIPGMPWAGPQFLSHCFKQATELGSRTGDQQVVAVVEVPSEQIICLVQFEEITPPSPDEDKEKIVRRMLNAKAQRDFLRNWMSREQIRKRAAPSRGL